MMVAGPLFDATRRLEQHGHHVHGWEQREGMASTSCIRCGQGVTLHLESGMLAGPALQGFCAGRREPHPEGAGEMAPSEER